MIGHPIVRWAPDVLPLRHRGGDYGYRAGGALPRGILFGVWLLGGMHFNRP